MLNIKIFDDHDTIFQFNHTSSLEVIGILKIAPKISLKGRTAAYLEFNNSFDIYFFKNPFYFHN